MHSICHNLFYSPLDMKNEFILLLIENKEADSEDCNADCQRINEMAHCEHSAVKHTATEHFRY